MATMRHLLTDESGATAVEYGLIVALIAVVAVTAMKAVGLGLVNTFNTVAINL